LEPVSGSHPVLEALRKQLAENIERLRKSGRLAPGAEESATGADAARPELLDEILRRRLSAVDRRSADWPQRARRVFVESVLASEFGDAILLDPGFGEMARTIDAALRDDALVSKQLDDLVAEL
jgi:hypothetical protein